MSQAPHHHGDRARCQPVKVGLAAEVEAMIRDHARPRQVPAETQALASTLAVLKFGDTPEHVARMKAENPNWDQTRGMLPLAEGLLASDWFARVVADAEARGRTQQTG